MHMFEKLESRVLMSVSPNPMAITQRLVASPAISDTQKANLQKLKTDLTAIHAKSDVTSDQITALTADLQTIAQTATKPSAASVNKLVTDYKAAAGDKVITPAERVVLSADVQNVLTSAGISAQLAEQTAGDFKAIVISSNVTVADVQTIDADLKAIFGAFKAR